MNLLEQHSDSLLNVPLSASSKDRILAAIDVGTNSVHMVVVRVQPAFPAFSIIAREKETVRLGDRDKDTGKLTIAAMERALGALRRCQDIAKNLNVEEIIAVATSAVREASNGRDFLARIQTELGLAVNLISGTEEARRIYLGVLSGMEFDRQPHVIIDIGGGSTELILGDGHEPRSLSSTKVGAVRLTSEIVTTDPISPIEFGYLQAYVRGMLERSVDELKSQLQPDEFPRLIGTSGTIETLASLYAIEKLGYVPSPLTGFRLSFRDLQDITNRLRRMTTADRAALPGMSDRRSEIIIAGALILQEAMSLLGMDELVVCERSLREGIIVDWMLVHGLIEDRLRYQRSVRPRSVIKIAQKYQVNLEHAKRVAALSFSLFNQTRNVLHTWGEEEQELLWASALLHNCGHYISHSSHHKHSYYLIRYGELLGFNELEIETIANIARYHRKSCPKKRHESYRSITSKRHRKIVDQLSAMLRLAVALDRRQIGAVERIRCEYRSTERELYLHLSPAQPEDDCALELWSLDMKKECFESEFGIKLNAALEPEFT